MAEAERPDPLAPPENYGYRVSPVTTTKTGERGPLADTLCAHGRKSTTAEAVCKNERTQIWTLGDVAEHIVPLDLCDEHAMLLAQRIAAGQPVQCTACRHTMRLEIRERYDPETGQWFKVPVDTPVLLAQIDQKLQDSLNELYERHNR